jgi:transposase
MIWAGAPIHRRHSIQAVLAKGATLRLPLERLPAYTPELNLDEGLWQQRTGVALRHLCCVNLPHLRRAWRDAVQRERHTPHPLHGFFRGANL